MTERRIEYLPLSQLASATRNPKAHALQDIGQSVDRFGYVEPVVLDERTQRLVAGHGRIKTLTSMREYRKQPPDGIEVGEDGEWLMPVVRGWASKSDRDAEAFLIASNRLTELGGWHDADLAALLDQISRETTLDGTGFSADDLARMLRELEIEQAEPEKAGEDDVPATPDKSYVEPGDIWVLGDHRIMCGDCRSMADVEKLLVEERINVAVTSPPYASQRTYDETSGFKPIAPDAYVEWFRDVSANVLAFLADDGSWFVNIKEHCEDGQRHLYVKELVIAHVRQWGWRFVDELCWVRSAPPGAWPDRFKNGFEPVFHFAKGGGAKFRPDAVSNPSDGIPVPSSKVGANLAGPNGKHWNLSSQTQSGLARPSNVIECSGVEGGTGHPAAFPVALPEFFIKAFSDGGDVIFEPFSGSGTTLIAAEKTKRRAFGMELSPRYVQVAIERWQKFTGREAAKV
jgi:site-specific DNA-methyltransferase (adenine-specific)